MTRAPHANDQALAATHASQSRSVSASKLSIASSQEILARCPLEPVGVQAMGSLDLASYAPAIIK